MNLNNKTCDFATWLKELEQLYRKVFGVSPSSVSYVKFGAAQKIYYDRGLTPFEAITEALTTLTDAD